ncbi:chitinase-like protein 4 [Nilaparvata lugens]|uniref:chitinase-like protein 4 n=1 Tax=Nilaparvata lugens TaxID=108931 RepID=UPI00193E6640|nr:chitinase-like protein 4 [Nilaparvata lugens]
MTSSANRRTFISSTVRMLHEYNFDGLDLHWQLPELEGTTPSDPPTRSPADPSTLTRLLEEMSPVFESRAWTLTLSLTGSRFQAEDIYPNDMQQVTTHLTHLLLKSYDLHVREERKVKKEG